MLLLHTPAMSTIITTVVQATLHRCYDGMSPGRCFYTLLEIF